MRIDKYSFALYIIMVGISIIIITLSGEIAYIHQNDVSAYFSSDGAQYVRLYQQYLADGGLDANFSSLIVVGSPIIMLLLAKGEIYFVLLFTLLIFFTSLRRLIYCFTIYNTQVNRKLFIFLSLLNPFVFLGFFSINKELFLIASSFHLISYYISGRKSDIIFCLLIALLARAYMLPVYFFVVLAFPRGKEIRWWVVFLTLLLMSVVAPYILSGGVFGSHDSALLTSNAGSVAIFLSNVNNNFLYFIFYIPKYIVLVVYRLWSLLLYGGELEYASNIRDGLTSLYSMCLIVIAMIRRRRGDLSNKIFWIAVLSPIPIMFSDIMHWRYYLFTLPMYLMVVLTNRHSNYPGMFCR